MDIKLPWKEMDKHVGTLGTGLHVVLHSKIKGNWFFFDALAVPLVDTSENGTEFVFVRNPADVRQGIDSAWDILVEDKIYPPGNIWTIADKKSLEEIIEACEKAKNWGSSRAIFIDDIGKVVGEDGAPVQWDVAAAALKHMAVDLVLPVIVGIGSDCDMTGYRHMEMCANTIFRVGESRNFDCIKGYVACKESAESEWHKKLLVEVIKNQSGALGRFKI